MVLFGDGFGGFPVQTVIPAGGPVLVDVATGDLDEDGHLDLVVTSYTGSLSNPNYHVAVLLGDGAGGFTAGYSTSTLGSAASGAGPVKLADVDGDNHLDAIVYSAGYDEMLYLLGDGSGDLVFDTSVGTPSDPADVMRVADLNDDGRPDFVVARSSGNSVSAYLNATGGPLPFAATFRRGDVNADGAVDVSDAVELLQYLFGTGTSSIPCDDAADTDDDGSLVITDAIALLNYLFVSGSPPPASPGPDTCGLDPTPDSLGGCGTGAGLCP